MCNPLNSPAEVSPPGPADSVTNAQLGAIRNELHRLTTAYSCPGEPDLLFERVSPSFLPQIESTDLVAANERNSQLSGNFGLKHDCNSINQLQRCK